MRLRNIDIKDKYPELFHIAEQIANQIPYKLMDMGINKDTNLCTLIRYMGNVDDLVLLIPFIESELFKKQVLLRYNLEFCLCCDESLTHDKIFTCELYCTVK